MDQLQTFLIVSPITYKRSFNKAVAKTFCKISFRDIGSERNLEMYSFARTFSCVCSRAFAYTVRTQT